MLTGPSKNSMCQKKRSAVAREGTVCYVLAMWIDTHCHLALEDFRTPDGTDERPAVLARARQAGVQQMVVIGSGAGWDDIAPALEMAHHDPHVYAALGVHPNDAHILAEDTKTGGALWQRMEKTVHADARVVAVGETGLDLYRTTASLAQQTEAFLRFLRLAYEANKPLSLHIRDAHREAWACVNHVPGVRGVVHCFTGTPAEAQVWLEMGFVLSFSGIVTFPKSYGVQEACRQTPVERLVLETDCPYLAPVPVRGTRNEPAYVAHTGAFVATLRGVDAGTLAAQTTQVARALFGLPAPLDAGRGSPTEV